jgi:hypothetical protein
MNTTTQVAATSLRGQVIQAASTLGDYRVMASRLRATRDEVSEAQTEFEAALDAALAGQEWQPINTAPKSLAPLLLWLPPVGAWAAGPWRGSWSFVDETWVLHTPLTMEGKAVCLSENPEPTHWRAMPPDPITAPGGAAHG